nr:unnamed protein product [Digitaria exilis]
MATTSSVILMLLAAFAVAGACAATFTVKNNCGFTVWPAATPPNDVKTHACNGNSNYQVTFCP